MTTVIDGYNNKLKSRLFGLLCEFEKDGAWEPYLDSILMELMGIPDISRGINYYIIFYKISSLRFVKYKYFRTIVFDCMSMLSKTNSMVGDIQ